MQLSQAIAGLEAAVDTQLSVAGPEASELGAQLMAALQPAIERTLTDILCMAAAEISSQLPGHNVDVKLVDGQPELVVTSESPLPPPHAEDDTEARITVRLPAYLKDLIAEAASTSGDSVNSFVIDALRNQAHTAQTVTKGRVKGTVEL